MEPARHSNPADFPFGRLICLTLDAIQTEIGHGRQMNNAMLNRLNTIDVAILTDVVRQDQRDPAFAIDDWSIRRLSDKGIANPDGLWLFSGRGHNGHAARQWSVVVKIFLRPEEESPPDELYYWKREFLLAQTGLLERLPGPVRAPRFYRTDEYPESIWIWMEHLFDRSSGSWRLEHYAIAARQLGLWNGACLAMKVQPDESWFARRHYVTWLNWLNIEKDWQFPMNQVHVSVDLRQRYENLWAEHERFYKALDGLPQVFSHFDSQRRNLFICQNTNQQDELVLVDWAQCGWGALGAELNWLVGMSGGLLEWPPVDLTKLDAVAFENYLQGLQDAGWCGDREVVRLGYVAYLSVFMGCIFPAFTALWCSPEQRLDALHTFGLAEEELFWKILPLLNYSLDCADEARQLMNKIGVS